MNILNLPDWEVLEINESQYDYTIDAQYKKGLEACPHCGVIGQLYRHGVKKQRYMDMPIHCKRVGIIVHRQRYRCRACNQTSFQPLPDMHEAHSATNRLVDYISKESMKRTFVSVADDTGIHERTVRRLFQDETERLSKQVHFETPRWLGIDEVHLVKRPRCLLTNIEQHTVIDLLTNRNKDTVCRYLYNLPHRERIELVTMDMWEPYKDAVYEMLPQATIVIDKFHVIRLVIDGMDQVRKETRSKLTARQSRTLKRDRYILFHRAVDLDAQDKFILNTWLGAFPLLGQAYRLKEEFCDLWALQDKQEAQEKYQKWVNTIPAEIEASFKPLTTAMGNWSKEIFSYWEHPVTNAYSEAVAGLTKIINRNGRGYSFEAIRAKLLYSSLSTTHKPVFSRRCDLIVSDIPRNIYMPNSYGMSFSTLIELLTLLKEK
jgi:transposase